MVTNNMHHFAKIKTKGRALRSTFRFIVLIQQKLKNRLIAKGIGYDRWETTEDLAQNRLLQQLEKNSTELIVY